MIRNLNSASLSSLTNAGAFSVSDNTTITLAGTINNTGSIYARLRLATLPISR